MEFVGKLKEHLRNEYQKSYENYCEMMKGFKLNPDSYEEYIEKVFRKRINCGGYAFEIDSCIFLQGLSFEQAVSSLLEQIPFIRLLGNTELLEDEYIVKYRTAKNGIGHHFVKLKDGKITEKDTDSEIRNFEEWVDVLKNRPEAIFAVKKNHDRKLDGNFIYLKDGKDFDETVLTAYQEKQNHFEYHCHSYSFKKDSSGFYIYSNSLKIADLLIEDNECIAIINDGMEDYISNTKTNYTIGKEEPREER